MAYEPIARPRLYLGVLTALVVLTFATVGISFLSLPGGWHAGLGLSIGLIKAALVVLFFMHLSHSPKLNRLIVIVALAWLLCVLIGLTYTETLTRGLVEGMPGH